MTNKNSSGLIPGKLTGVDAVNTNILVSVGKLPGRDLGEVSIDLKQAGMKIVDVLDLSRIVTGTVDDSNIPKLRKVPGVMAVDLDVEFNAQ